MGGWVVVWGGWVGGVGGLEYAGTSKYEAPSGSECWLDSSPQDSGSINSKAGELVGTAAATGNNSILLTGKLTVSKNPMVRDTEIPSLRQRVQRCRYGLTTSKGSGDVQHQSTIELDVVQKIRLDARALSTTFQ